MILLSLNTGSGGGGVFHAQSKFPFTVFSFSAFTRLPDGRKNYFSPKFEVFAVFISRTPLGNSSSSSSIPFSRIRRRRRKKEKKRKLTFVGKMWNYNMDFLDNGGPERLKTRPWATAMSNTFLSTSRDIRSDRAATTFAIYLL